MKKILSIVVGFGWMVAIVSVSILLALFIMFISDWLTHLINRLWHLV